MAWRVPRFCWFHAAREAGASSISSAHAFHADYPKTRLIDERSTVNCKFAESTSGHTIVIDRGSSTPSLINRLFIPSGHNFYASTDIELESDDTSGFTSATTLIDHTVSYGETGGGMNVGSDDISIDFAVNNERWLRLSWPGQTGQWEIPELWLTFSWPTTRGPEPSWTDQKIHNAIAIQKASGEIPVVETGASQREFEFTYLRCEAADTTILELLIDAVGISRPFILDPPYDDEDPIVVKLAAPVRVVWDHPVPTAGTKTKRFVLRMLESLE